MSSPSSSSSSSLLYTPVAEIPTRVEAVRSYFNSHITKSVSWRKKQLQGLLRLLTENEKALTDALNKDVGKPEFEASLTEVVTAIGDVRATLGHIDEWVQPERTPTPLSLLPGKSYITREPYGVVLIIAPFNYPVQLTILPITAAITAGNTVVLKPSELTPTTSALLANLLPRYIDPSAIAVIQGSIDETTALLKLKYDYIFFTGSEFVGKIVAKAAAEHLTPITLELGGKSPSIVTQDSDVDLAARRTVWGKCLNAGQSCIAPDYVFVHSSVQKEFVAASKKYMLQWYGEDAETSPHFARIINERHTKRLQGLIEAHKKDIIFGGKVNVEKKFVAPTVVVTTLNSQIMQEEIFGPVLPIVTYENLDDVINYVNQRPKPLALYIFSTNQTAIDKVINLTSSGGVSVNDTMMHFANHYLPFGGVGQSGQGAYHGKFGYLTFSHSKSVLHKSNFGDSPARYPPYTASNYRLFRYVSEIYRVNSTTFNKFFKYVFLPVVVAVLAKRYGISINFKSKM